MVWQLLSQDFGYSGKSVIEANDIVIFATIFDLAGPADQVGHTVPAFPYVAFMPAIFAAGIVACLDELFKTRVVRVAIVGSENDDRVVRDSGLVYRFDDLAGGPIRFHYEVGDRIDSAFAFEFLRWDHRLVGGGHGEKEKKGLFFARLIAHVFNRPLGDLRQDAIEFPSWHNRAPLEAAGHDDALVGIVDITLRWLFDDPVVFDEGEGGEIGYVGAEVIVESASNRAVFNRFGEVPFLVHEPVALLDHLTWLRSGPVPAEMPLSN